MFGILTCLLESARQLMFGAPGCSYGRRVRPLGMLEELMERDNKDNVMMMARMVFLESKQEIPKEYIKLALDHLIRKYPILRMRISGHLGKLYWCEIEEFCPDLQFEDSGNWTAIFGENSNATFDSENGPLWRAIFISNVKSPYTDHQNFKYQYALLLGFHHALFDGRSNLLVMNDFQHILNSLLQGAQLSLPDYVSAEKMDKPLDEYIIPQLTLWERSTSVLYAIPLVSSIARWLQTYRLKETFRQENLFMEQIGKFVTKPQERTCVKQMVLTKTESQDLFSACKQRRITVQSMLQTASSLALCEVMKHPVLCHNVASIPNLLSVDVNCMLGIKSILPSIPTDSLGYFSVSMPCKLNISEFSDFWDLASQTQRQIHGDQKGVADRYLKDVWFSVQADIKSNEALLEVSSCGRYPGLLMAYSNLGNCTFLNMEDTSEVRINGQVAACSEHKVGAIFSHSVLTLLGRLHWNVGYYKNICSEEVIEFYTKETKRILLEAMKDTKQT